MQRLDAPDACVRVTLSHPRYTQSRTADQGNLSRFMTSVGYAAMHKPVWCRSRQSWMLWNHSRHPSIHSLIHRSWLPRTCSQAQDSLQRQAPAPLQGRTAFALSHLCALLDRLQLTPDPLDGSPESYTERARAETVRGCSEVSESGLEDTCCHSRATLQPHPAKRFRSPCRSLSEHSPVCIMQCQQLLVKTPNHTPTICETRR